MVKNPLVSIIIPVYNGTNFLKEAIDSALAQTYKNIEIIVINDGSNDKGMTAKIAKSYGNKIRYFEKENGGVSTALNLGISKMNGTYFSWLSHDDKYLSNKVSYQIEFLLKNEYLYKNIIVYSDFRVINENGLFIEDRVLNSRELNIKNEYSLLTGAINGITLLIPKKAFEQHGNFKEELRCTQDYDMWLRLLKTYKFIHIPMVLAMTRIHEGQDTNINPKVITEGNPLWIRIIESISNERKEQLEGNEYNFYLKIAKELSKTPYRGALQYCIDKLNKLDGGIKLSIKAFVQTNQRKNSLISLIKKTFVAIRKIGFKKTIDKIKRFFVNRRLNK